MKFNFTKTKRDFSSQIESKNALKEHVGGYSHFHPPGMIYFSS